MSNIAFATLMILLVLPVYYLAVIAHELGHVVAGWCVGFRVCACGTGMGKPLIRLRLLGIVWFIGRIRPTGGLTVVLYPSLSTSRWRQGVYFLGGIIANLLLAIGAIVIFFSIESSRFRWFVGLIAYVNACLAYASLLPIEIQAGPIRFASDSRQILALLTGRERSRLTEALTSTRGVSELAAKLQIAALEHRQLLCGAMLWCEIGSVTKARERFDRAESVITEEERANPTAFALAVKAQVLALENRTQESISAAEQASCLFQREEDRVGQILMNWFLALTHLSISDVESAGSFLEQIVADGRHHRQFRYSAQMLRQKIQVMQGAPGSANALLEWFARLPVSKRDPAWAMATYRSLGNHFFERGERIEAERWFGHAMRTASKVAKGLLYSDDLEAFEIVRAQLSTQLEDLRASQTDDSSQASVASA